MSQQDFPRCWGAGPTARTISLVGSTGSPAGVTGERNFPPRWGCGKRVFLLAGSRRTTKPRERDSPARVTGERDFRGSGWDFPRCWGAGFAGFGDPPPGSPGSGIFDRVPRRGYRGAEFSPAEVAGSAFFPRRGQVQGVKGHSILHCTPWLAGILRSVDSICWQGADLEAVAFSCTGRHLARAANGLGFRV